MAKAVKLTTLILGIILIALILTYVFVPHEALLSVTITVGVFFYHFFMRLCVGVIVNAICKNKVNYTKKWFQEKKWEQKFFEIIKIKKWKKHVPTYSPEAFDPKIHTLTEIASATCQSEIVHEIIMVLSLLPILLYIPFGTLAVFIITSVLASLFDGIFVLLQRYNRPRLIKIIERNQRKLS